MEYLNDLHLKYPQEPQATQRTQSRDSNDSGQADDSLVATFMRCLGWEYRIVESRCRGVAVGVRRLSIQTARPVRSLRCSLRVSIDSSEGGFGAHVSLGLSSFLCHCG